MRTHHSVLLALTLSIAACGGGTGDAKEAGFQALQSGDFADAAGHFEQALATRSPSDEDYVEIAVGHCQALAHIDPAQTKTTFLALGDQVTPKDYSIVVVELVAVREFVTAIDILEAGVTRFPESPKMSVIKDRVVKASLEVGDSAALAKLKGLGYL
ncbi:MAG: hypothetical protein E2O39_14665 [Planctomycetota bacterium]|nr:MAG: hypothetical protein E2O39_14665 [Planctomycetota bacterium]